jgi:hypothetical protein
MKSEIITSNKYKAKLVAMRKELEAIRQERDYEEFVKRTKEAIDKINQQIRATNK